MNVRQMGRAAAAAGALVAAGAAALVAVGGVANAAGTGRCSDNVNVREKPDITSKIVAVCERGQAVQIGKTRDGFVQLTDLGGWATQEYVLVDGHAPAAPASRSSATSTSAKPRPGAHAHGTADPTDEDGTATSDPDADSDGVAGGADTSPTDAATTPAQPPSMGSALGRLFG
jgi:uncharacterized protein YgiM (DUF1202 family)